MQEYMDHHGWVLPLLVIYGLLNAVATLLICYTYSDDDLRLGEFYREDLNLLGKVVIGAFFSPAFVASVALYNGVRFLMWLFVFLFIKS